MKTIADILIAENKARQNKKDWFVDIFFNFYIKNYKKIHQEITMEEIKRLAVLEPFINLNKNKLDDVNDFNSYIEKLDGVSDDKMVGNIIHHVNVTETFEASFIKKALEFCIREQIDINNHTQRELDLFEINIIN